MNHGRKNYLQKSPPKDKKKKEKFIYNSSWPQVGGLYARTARTLARVGEKSRDPAWRICINALAAQRRLAVSRHPKCRRCDNTVHVCARCDPVDTCVQCTKRPHICLSKCIRGCIHKKAPVCNCGSTPRRLQVQKDSQNKGRYFWSCHDCAFFEWDAWLRVLASRFRLPLTSLRLYIHQTLSPTGGGKLCRRQCRRSRRLSRSLLFFYCNKKNFFLFYSLGQ